MNSKLTIFDDNAGQHLLSDKANIKGTDVILKSMDNGKVLFRGHNKVIVSGSEFNALKDFDYDGFVGDTDFLASIPSYDVAFRAAGKELTTADNEPLPIELSEYTSNYSYYTGTSDDSMLKIFSALSLDDEPTHKLYRSFSRRVCLWCVGIDGCGIEASRVFKVQNTKWIAPYGYWDYSDGSQIIVPEGADINDLTCLIPFKYRTIDADLSPAFRQQYHGRMKNAVSAIGYFFKTFDETPELIRRYADDSTDLSGVDDVWKDKRTSDAETVVKLKMSVSATDCREYFNRSTGHNDAKINTLSLCTAIPYLYNGELVYTDIRPFTRFNFPNESLIDYSKGIDITYYLYY